MVDEPVADSETATVVAEESVSVVETEVEAAEEGDTEELEVVSEEVDVAVVAEDEETKPNAG